MFSQNVLVRQELGSSGQLRVDVVNGCDQVDLSRVQGQQSISGQSVGSRIFRLFDGILEQLALPLVGVGGIVERIPR
jgi:hypothetical protein